MQISELTRRNILEALLLRGNISGKLDTLTFLKRTWALDDMPSTDPRFPDAAGDIWQHTVNNYDWEDSYLYSEYLGLQTAPDYLFERFVESVVHPLVRQDDDQQEVAALLNKYLERDGRRLVKADEISGHPIFRVNNDRRGVGKAAKNLIFAANGAKPEIVLADAVSNDITITKNAEYCLIYDQPIPTTGLLWKDLVRWWGRLRQTDEDSIDTERALYGRLYDSLSGSPAEQLLFDTYFRRARSKLGPLLPALIPQVYLHFDPYTIRYRGGTRLLIRQRMDFLLILAGGRRIVIEVDGVQHYANDGEASPTRYAEMMFEDRKLRLSGYEVYRFGGAELQGDPGRGLIERFFLDLFATHEILAI